MFPSCQISNNAHFRSSRQSWFFIQPPTEADDQVPEKSDPQTRNPQETKRGYFTSYSQKKFSIAPIPQISESEDSNSSAEAAKPVVKSTRTTRASTSNRKQKK